MDEIYDEVVEYKETKRPKKKRKKRHYFRNFLILIGVLVALLLFSKTSVFNVKTIEIVGNDYYQDDEIISMANISKGKNIFWEIDSSNIKDRLKETPYFSEVDISKKLSGKLVITLKEREQIAAIAYGNSFVVIDKNGIVLRKTNTNPKLTLLTGLTISKLKPGQAVEAIEKKTLNKALNMLSAMKDGDIFFKKIDISRVIIKAWIYDTLVVKGTPKQIKKFLKNGDLQKVVNNLFKNDTTRGTINLGNDDYMSFSPEF